MKPMERIKLSKERAALVAQLNANALKAVAKIKAAKRVSEIVVLLGGAVAQERSTLARYPDDFELHYLGDKAANWTASELAPISPCVPEVVILS